MHWLMPSSNSSQPLSYRYHSVHWFKPDAKHTPKLQLLANSMSSICAVCFYIPSEMSLGLHIFCGLCYRWFVWTFVNPLIVISVTMHSLLNSLTASSATYSSSHYLGDTLMVDFVFFKTHITLPQP